jgi:hypothetical protein
MNRRSCSLKVWRVLPEPFSQASRPCARLPAAWAPAVAVVATVRFEANAVPTARPHQVGRTALEQNSTLAPPSPRRARNLSSDLFVVSNINHGEGSKPQNGPVTS